MFLDEPNDRLGFRRTEPQTRTQLLGNFRTDNGMIFCPTLADVVEEGRYIKRAAIADCFDDFRRKRQLVGSFATFDTCQHADRANEMFVHRVMVVHIELHHGDDLSEVRDETAKHAGFVHTP